MNKKVNGLYRNNEKMHSYYKKIKKSRRHCQSKTFIYTCTEIIFNITKASYNNSVITIN